MNKFLFRKVGFNDPTAPPVVPPPPPAAPPKFTDEQQKAINDIVAAERRKGEEKNSQLIAQLEAIKKSKALSEEERNNLTTQIEALRTEYMTKEQLQVDSFKKKENEYTTRLKALEEGEQRWQGNFYGLLKKNAILQAAADKEVDAFNPEQILELLETKTKVVPKLDGAGNAIDGEFLVKVPLPITDDKGNSKVLELDPKEALLKMKEINKYQNLFNSSIKGGLGGKNQGQGGPDNLAAAILDPAKWKEARKKEGFSS